MGRWLRRIAGWVVGLAATTVLLAAVVVPRVAGATPYTVLTGSMEPDLPPGSLVVARPVPADEIGVGSVVTYQLESGRPVFVTHRVVSQGVGDDGDPIFQTQGDANDSPDATWVRPLQVRGELWYAVPYVGYLSDFFSPRARQVGVYLVAAALLLYALLAFAGAARDRGTTRRHREHAHV